MEEVRHQAPGVEFAGEGREVEPSEARRPVEALNYRPESLEWFWSNKPQTHRMSDDALGDRRIWLR